MDASRPSHGVTSHDVAKVAGVSQATVSRVLREDAHVRPETRARVHAALTATGYEPHALARSFRTRRADAIGVVVARLSYQLFPAMLEALGQRIAQAGLRMVVWDAEFGGDLPASKALKQGLVDGVILLAATRESQFLHDTVSPQAPVVLVNRMVEGYPCDQIGSDNLGGASQVAHYFVQAGRRRLALVGGLQRASPIREREQGFRDALVALGQPLSDEHYHRSETFTHASGVEAARQMLSTAHPPDAIFCVNDVLATGVMDGARAMGVRIPEDLWVVGYDDIELASWGAYQLTTVHQPMLHMVEQGLELLRAKIAQPDKPLTTIRHPNHLVIRRSSDPV